VSTNKKGVKYMQLVDNLKQIVEYVCENFEELDMDDPVEEGYIDDYEEICGATDEDIKNFEEKFGITLPEDVKELYRYKNGSKFFALFPCIIGERDMAFNLMSLEQVEKSKGYFQNKDALLTDFPDYFTNEDIERMKDERIKPYLFNKKWFPFAEYCDSCYLMLDFDPGKEGKEGQIICYIHDPDEVVYVTGSLTELVENIMEEIES
jgi:hypothetical protein